jgi:hypothetical protein
MTGICAREYGVCDQPAGGYRGKFLSLCSKHARVRVVSIELRRRERRHALLGRGR